MNSQIADELRLAYLRDLEILDTASEQSFDNLTQMAAKIFEVPIVAVSLVDSDRQWFKSSVGLSVCETGRDVAFCDHVVRDERILNVPDTHLDVRFKNNPLVTGNPYIRSYLGYPLIPDGQYIIGTLCIIDTKIRHYSPEQIELLGALALQVENLIRLHSSRIEINKHAERLRSEKLSISQSQARYAALLSKAAAGIICIDQRGAIMSANEKLLDILGYEEAELIGQNVKLLMPMQIAVDHDGYLERYQRGSTQSMGAQSSVIGGGRELVARHKNGELVPIHLAVNEVINPTSHDREFIGIITDIKDQKIHERKMLAERALLSTLHRGITDFTALLSGNQLWQFLQESLLDLTESQYSFIGEVIAGKSGPALKIHAITDLSWNDDSRKLAQELLAGDMMIENTQSLIGKVFAKGETVIVPNMALAQGKGGQPHGHPELYNYLGIPIIDNGEIIGMFAIANTDKEINEDLANWLEPFTATCSLLIRFYRMISQNKSVMEQLKTAKDEMEAASRAKTEFLSSMSHELRTPLNSIIGFSQLMLSQTKQPLPDKQRKQTEQIHASGKHLLTLINEILDLAKIEAGKLSLSIEPSNVATLTKETIATVQPMADAAGITLSYNVDERISVLADYTRLKQVLINLLSNAVKYNRDNGSVDVVARLNEFYAEIAVKDSGIGIDMDKIDELFEPFNRMGAENSTIEGTGVGLALTKKLVEYMNGEIHVTSDDHGTTFTVVIPLAEETLQWAAEKANACQEALTGEEIVTERKKLLVLYVEDNPANQYLMEEIFEEMDALTLKCVHEPFLGFDMAKHLHPDLIILDINLPQIDGFELLKMMQMEPKIAHIPVIALSANAMQADIAKGIAAGFDNYLTKPVDVPVFMDILNGYVRQIIGE